MDKADLFSCCYYITEDVAFHKPLSEDMIRGPSRNRMWVPGRTPFFYKQSDSADLLMSPQIKNLYDIRCPTAPCKGEERKYYERFQQLKPTVAYNVVPGSSERKSILMDISCETAPKIVIEFPNTDLKYMYGSIFDEIENRFAFDKEHGISSTRRAPGYVYYYTDAKGETNFLPIDKNTGLAVMESKLFFEALDLSRTHTVSKGRSKIKLETKSPKDDREAMNEFGMAMKVGIPEDVCYPVITRMSHFIRDSIRNLLNADDLPWFKNMMETHKIQGITAKDILDALDRDREGLHQSSKRSSQEKAHLQKLHEMAVIGSWLIRGAMSASKKGKIPLFVQEVIRGNFQFGKGRNYPTLRRLLHFYGSKNNWNYPPTVELVLMMVYGVYSPVINYRSIYDLLSLTYHDLLATEMMSIPAVIYANKLAESTESYTEEHIAFNGRTIDWCKSKGILVNEYDVGRTDTNNFGILTGLGLSRATNPRNCWTTMKHIHSVVGAGRAEVLRQAFGIHMDKGLNVFQKPEAEKIEYDRYLNPVLFPENFANRPGVMSQEMKSRRWPYKL